MMRKKEKREGFTLAELLIVVAIIATLVAISIPVFTSQLKKSKLAVDHSAIRDAYALIQVANNTESVEINGVLYTFSQLRSKYADQYVVFVLSEDCSYLLEYKFPFPENSYMLKENGYGEREDYYCDTCAEIGKNVAKVSVPYSHIKDCPIYACYSKADNFFYLGYE